MTGLPNERLSAALRGFGLLGVLAIIVVLISPNALIGAVFVLVWMTLSCTSWSELGFVKPASWTVTIIAGVALGITLKLVMKAVVMPLLGAEAVNHVYHYVAGNPPALAAMALTVIVSGGFGEETVYRGFLFERLGKLLGRTVPARVFTVAITSALFAAMHLYDQGIPGAEQALFTGLVFGGIFAATRSIWVPMIAHAVFDLTALALIYWNLEPTVAHFIFK